MAWSVEQALAAEGVGSVWVSSDSDEILEVSRSYGAETIRRPATLSTADASSESAWLHALTEIDRQKGGADVVVALQATSPLREPTDIDHGIDEFRTRCFDSLFSGSPLSDFFVWERAVDGSLRSVNYEYRERRVRQDAPEQFVENGSFYVFTPELLRRAGNRLGGKIGVAEMALWKAFEIDTSDDLEMCAVLMRHYLLSEARA